MCFFQSLIPSLSPSLSLHLTFASIISNYSGYFPNVCLELNLAISPSAYVSAVQLPVKLFQKQVQFIWMTSLFSK